MELREMSLAEIRRRLATRRRVTASLLAQLRRDPRAGARALADELGRRRGREAAERRRLRGLFRAERELRALGLSHIAGVDEVGVGPLAGPVVAAAVVLPADVSIGALDDSKRVAPALREQVAAGIRGRAREVSIAWATAEEIDRLNIYQASLLAMKRAVEGLETTPERVLVDGRTIPEIGPEQRAVTGGDGRVASIAAASIVAKVYRDAWMRDLDRRYPGYGFARNVGYGTLEHRQALGQLGPCPAHRYSFGPVREACAALRRGA
jgi:ribonuclease HII